MHSFESPPSPIPLEHYHQQIIHQTMLYNFRNCRICTRGHFESKKAQKLLVVFSTSFALQLPPYAFVEKFQKSIKPKSGQTIIELNE